MKPAEIFFRAGAVALYWALKRDTLFHGHAISKISKTFLCEKMQIPGESLPPCRGLWGTLHTGDDIDCKLVSSGSAKSRTHQSAVGGFLVTRRGWPGRLRACRIWTFINSV